MIQFTTRNLSHSTQSLMCPQTELRHRLLFLSRPFMLMRRHCHAIRGLNRLVSLGLGTLNPRLVAMQADGRPVLVIRHIAVHITWKSSASCERFVWHLSHCSFSPVLCRSKMKCTCETVAACTVSIDHNPCHTGCKSQANNAVNRSAQSRCLVNSRPSFAPGYRCRYAD